MNVKRPVKGPFHRRLGLVAQVTGVAGRRVVKVPVRRRFIRTFVIITNAAVASRLSSAFALCGVFGK